MSGLTPSGRIKFLVTGARGGTFADVARASAAFGAIPSDTDAEVSQKFANYAITQNPGFQSVIPGPADNTYTTLATFKASDISRKKASVDGISGIPDGEFYWASGDFSSTPSGQLDYNIIKADSTTLSVGAWLRLGASAIRTSSGLNVQSDLNSLQSDLDALEPIPSSLIAAHASDIAIRQQNAKASIAYPPLSTQADDYSDVVPTVAQPVAMCRLSARVILIRCGTAFDANNVCTEINQYVLLDPSGYANVAGGWQMVAQQGIIRGALHDFFNVSYNQADIPNPEFAFRIGPSAATYSSGGEGPDFAYAGFGHGRAINIPDNNQVIVDGAGANLQSVGAWPVGKRIMANNLSITCAYYLTFIGGTTLGSNPVTTTSGSGVITVTHTAHGLASGRFVQLLGFNDSAGINGITLTQLQVGGAITVVDANSYTITTTGVATATGSGGGAAVQASPDRVRVDYTKIFSGTGLTNVSYIQATVTGVTWQDFYGDMMPVNRNAATHFKLNGLPAVAITNDLSQKGNWTTTTATMMQAYHAAYPDVVMVHELLYGQPVRRTTGTTLTAWGLNKFGRVFFRDLSDFPKLYVFGGSSEEGLPRTAWPMAVGDVYSFQNRKSIKIIPGGAT